MAEINKHLIDKLAGLARIKFHGHEEQKLIHDLQKIFEYFKELEGVNTDNIVPMTGGTVSKNVFRPDEPRRDKLGAEGIVEAFPEQENEFLKIPPVFEG